MTRRPDEIDAVAADWRPSRVADREVILDAITACAAANKGYVHVADVREHLARELNDPHQLGAVVTTLVRSKHLRWTGKTRANGNTKTRNAERPAKLYRLVKPLPREAAA